MSAPDETTDKSSASDSASSASHRRGWRRRWLVLGIVPALAAGALFLPRAFAHGHGFGWHGCHHRRASSADELREHMRFKVGRLLERVDASDQQRAQIHDLVDGAAPQLFAYKQRGRQLRKSMAEAMQAEPVDAQALEAVRQDGLALADEASATALSLLRDVSGVLSAEQRAQIRQDLQRFAHFDD